MRVPSNIRLRVNNMNNSKRALDLVRRKHDISKLFDRFESFRKQCEERDIRIAMLESSEKPSYHRIAKQLRRCRKGRRCGRASCPICSRKYRRRLIGNELQIFEGSDDICIITLIIFDRLTPSSELFEINILRMMQRLTKQLERSSLRHAKVIGGWELKFDGELQLWVPHFHLVVQGSTKKQRNEFRERYYKGKRAMKVQKINNILEQLSYCLKYISLDNSEAARKRAWCKKKSYRLPLREHNLYLQFMARHHVKDFVFKRGLKSEGEYVRVLKN